MKIKKPFFFSLSLMVFLALQTPSIAGTEGVDLGESVVVTAEIVGIDKADRTLTLRRADGKVFDIEVSQEARNFDQIEIGDQIKAEYYESVALYLGKHGTKPDASEGLVAARSAKGEEPAAFAVETVDISAKVLVIDKKKRTLTLELPDGKKATTKVDPSVKAFDTLKVGDSIHARYTEAVAVSVEKP